MNKLLAVKRENNIVIYNIKYDVKNMMDLVRYLSKFYSYSISKEVTANIARENGRLIQAMELDKLAPICRISEDYKLLEDLDNIDSKTKKSRIKVQVNYDSKIASILKDLFLSDDIMLNCTDLIRLINHIFHMRNTFKFDPKLDLSNRHKSWDDLSRCFSSKEEYHNYCNKMKTLLNVDNIKLNKNEEEKLSKDIDTICDKLGSIINIENVGMFPIDSNLSELYIIFYRFGVRNEEALDFFNGIDKADKEININSAKVINELSSELIKKYSKEERIDETLNIKVKSFFKAA